MTMNAPPCPSCYSPLSRHKSVGKVAAALCQTCLDILAKAEDKERCRQILHAIDAPVLMMQPNPRLVFTANDRALSLFGKPVEEVEGYRGGDLFRCVHSYTELGCGKDANCDECKIKGAIVATFEGTDADGVSSPLTIRRLNDASYRLTLTSQGIGHHALVRVDGFQPIEEN